MKSILYSACDTGTYFRVQPTIPKCKIMPNPLCYISSPVIKILKAVNDTRWVDNNRGGRDMLLLRLRFKHGYVLHWNTVN